MSKQTTVTTTAPVVDYDPAKVYARIVIRDNGAYLIDETHGEQGPLAITKAGDAYILPENDSNRKWWNCKRAEALIAELGYVPLYYKPTKVLGPSSTHMPNEKLVMKWLSEEELVEYRAIVNRAITARDAARSSNTKTPVDEITKTKISILKSQIKLAEMQDDTATVETLTAELNALKGVNTRTTVHSSLVDYISDEDYTRFNELLDIAENNKKNAPKVSKPRGPMTTEQKIAATEKKIAAAQAKLDALLAEQGE